MTDIALRLVRDGADVLVDALLTLTSPDLVADEGLRTAVLVSLLTDAEDDTAGPGEDRRGWWGDALAEVPGDRIGSHLYRLERRKREAGLVSEAEGYCRAALAWLVEDGIARGVDVSCQLTGEAVAPRLETVVDVHRPTGTLRLRFDDLWNATFGPDPLAAELARISDFAVASGSLRALVSSVIPAAES